MKETSFFTHENMNIKNSIVPRIMFFDGSCVVFLGEFVDTFVGVFLGKLLGKFVGISVGTFSCGSCRGKFVRILVRIFMDVFDGDLG